MTAAFPTSIKNFGAARVDGDYIPASDINTVREEVVALETAVQPTVGAFTGGNLMNGYIQTLADGESISISQFRGMLLVSVGNNDAVEFILCSAGGTFVSMGSVSLTCTLNSDAGSTLAIFISGSTFYVKNKYGVSKSVRVQLFGN